MKSVSGCLLVAISFVVQVPWSYSSQTPCEDYCAHGICNELNSCDCLPCYTGEKCDVYVDNSRPYFVNEYDSIVIPPTNKGFIYKVQVIDDDFIGECSFATGNTSCPCGEFKLKLEGGEQYFTIESETGDIYTNEGTQFELGQENWITIKLLPFSQTEQDEETDYPTMTLKITVNEDKQNFNIKNPQKIREKRAALSITRTNINATLSLANAVPDPVKVGQTMEFVYELVFSQMPTSGTPLDISVEIYGLDIESGITSLALCNVNIDSVGSALKTDSTTSLTDDKITIQKINDKELIGVISKAIVTFPPVYNSDSYGGNDFTDSTVIIKFTAIRIYNPSYTNSTVAVTVGSMFDGDKQIAVSQGIGTVAAYSASDYPTNIVLAGPDTIELYSGKTFVIDAYIINPYGNLKFEVTSVNLRHDEFSVESLSITRSGANHACGDTGMPQVKYYKSITGETNYKAETNFTHILYNLNTGNLVSEGSNAANLMKIYFTLFAYHGATVGGKIEGSVAIALSENLIWTAPFNMTVAAATTPAAPAGTPTSMTASALDTRTNPPQVLANQAATWALKFDVGRAASFQIDCTCTPATDHIVSGLSFGKIGANIGRVPAELPAVYSSGGVTIAGLISNTTAAYSDATLDPAEDYIEIEITILYLTNATQAVTVNCESGLSATLSVQAGGSAVEYADISAFFIGPTTDVYLGSQAAFFVSLKFPYDTLGYSEVIFETGGDFANTEWGGKICRVDVISAGNAVSSIWHKEHDMATTVKYTTTSGTSLFNDSLSFPIGPLASAFRSINTFESSNEIKIRVVLDFPAQQTISADPDFNVTAGIRLGETGMYVGHTTTIGSAGPPAFNSSNPPLYLFVPPNPVIAGVTQEYKVYVKLPPGSSSNINIAAVSSDSSLLKICRVKYRSIGSNYGCLDRDIYNWPNDAEITSKAFVPNTDDPYSSIELQMGNVKNVGIGDFTDPSEFPDENAIEIVYFVKTIATATLTFTVADQRTSPLVNTTTMQPSEGVAFVETTESLTANFSGSDGTLSYFEDVPKEVDIYLHIPKGYKRNVSVETVNTTPNDVSLCAIKAVSAGANVGCFLLQDQIIEKAIGTSNEDVHTVHLGIITAINTTNDAKENIITLRVLAKVALGLPSATTFGIRITEGSTPMTDIEISLTLNTSSYTPPDNLNTTGLTLTRNSTAPDLVVQPGLLYWVPVSIVVPDSLTVGVEIAVMSHSEAGHASATIHNISWTGVQGKNIACVRPLEEHDVNRMANSSTDGIPMIRDNQNDTVWVKTVNLLNTGATHIMNSSSPEDDQIEFQVQLRIADHEKYANGDSIPLSFSLKIGDDVIVVLQVNLTLQKTGSEQIILATEFFLTDPLITLFNVHEQFSLTGRVSHVLNESQIEAYDSRIRILLPSYIEYINGSDPVLATATFTANTISMNMSYTLMQNHYIDLNITCLLFYDCLEFNISFTVDPYSKLLSGLDFGLNSTALMRLIGKKSSVTGTLEYLAPTLFVNYAIGPTACADDLLINTFDACQFSASTSIDSSVGPDKVALPGGWSPVTRDVSTWNHHVTIDLLRKIRVTTVIFTPVTGKREVATYKVQISNEGTYFTDACSNVLSASTPQLPPECETKSRYIRFAILTTTGDTLLSIGVSLSLKGCNLLGEVKDTCKLPSTFYSDVAGTGWRHVAFDPNTAIIYFCDNDPTNVKEMHCFCSVDGSQWTAMPSYIDTIHGFDASQGKMYAGSSSTPDVKVCSIDCNTWLLVSQAESDALSLVPPTIIAAGGSGDVSDATFGSWEVGYDGMSYGGVSKLKWNNCCS